MIMEFYGDTVRVPALFNPAPLADCSDTSIQRFIHQLPAENMQPYADALIRYRERHPMDDWLYYQLVRKVAQQLSPKADNYYRYTLYKWWLLAHSGYDTRLTWSGKYLLFYVQSDEPIYNIPFRMQEGKQYVCLNYHDYGNIDFSANRFAAISLPLMANARAFSYKVSSLPAFKNTDYTERQVSYEDGQNSYRFRIRLNPQIRNLFTNYPVVDYSVQFNMPLSKPTYESLIPELKKRVARMKPKEGVDFLLHFTRYAFLYKPDVEVFGANNFFRTSTATGAVAMTAAEVETKALAEGNIKQATPAGVLTDPFNLTAPNLAFVANGPAASGVDFTGMDAYFTPTTYKGAVGTTNWLQGWTRFPSKGQ